MATLPDDVLDALVRSEVGSSYQCTRVEMDHFSPLTVAIECAQHQVPKPLVVYKVTGGPPRSSSLPGLDPAPIIWSESESGMTTALARLLDTGSLARVVLGRASEALCLKILADFATDRGFTKAPRRLRAVADGLGVNGFILAPTFQEEHQRDLTEQRMTAGLFGVLHEAGHVYFMNSSHRVLTDAELEAQIDAASAEQPTVRIRKALDPEHLHEEICADVACITWLWSTTKNVMPPLTGKEADPIRFILAAASTFQAFAILNLCGQVAEDCASDKGFANDLDWFALRVGFQVRSTIVVDLAAKLAVQELGEEMAVRQVLNIALPQLGRRWTEVLTGFERARYEAYDPERSTMSPDALREPVREDLAENDASPGHPNREQRPGMLQRAWRATHEGRRRSRPGQTTP